MIYYHSSELRVGHKIIQDNEPCIIIDNEFVKPGKGQPFNRVRLRKLVSGKVFFRTFKSGECFQLADVFETSQIFLYNTNNFWYFINEKNFEELAVDIKVISDVVKWLVKQKEYLITIWNKQPISVTPPNFIELKVIDTIPIFKDNNISNFDKSAFLITGAVVKVPLFIQTGDIIKVNTRSNEYVSRVK